MNKITCVRIEGNKYNTSAMTPATMMEFVTDVNRTKDVRAVCKKYGANEV